MRTSLLCGQDVEGEVPEDAQVSVQFYLDGTQRPDESGNSFDLQIEAKPEIKVSSDQDFVPHPPCNDGRIAIMVSDEVMANQILCSFYCIVDSKTLNYVVHRVTDSVKVFQPVPITLQLEVRTAQMSNLLPTASPANPQLGFREHSLSGYVVCLHHSNIYHIKNIT